AQPWNAMARCDDAAPITGECLIPVDTFQPSVVHRRMKGVLGVDMKLEVVVLPVSDVDRAKRFYQSLGWRLDADFSTGDDFRVVQLTAPGSSSSIIFGTGVSTAGAGRVEGLHLAVADVEAARVELVAAG